jgi:transcriptional regulator with XRE-family HTH domain
MSKPLKAAAQDFVALFGGEAYEILAKRAGKSSMTIRRWLRGENLNPHTLYQLAKCLGYSDKEALRISKQPVSKLK